MTDLRPNYFTVTVPPLGACDLVEPKLDGQWANAVCDGSFMRFTGRNGRDLGSVPSAIPAGTVLIGEHMTGTARAIRSPDNGRFVAFDIIAFAHDDISATPLLERRALLVTLKVVVVDQRPAHQWRTFFDAPDCEGVVFKDSMGFYMSHWHRLKHQVTITFAIIGLTPSGFLLGDAKTLEPRGTVAAFTKLARKQVADHRDRNDLIGEHLECVGGELYPTGKLRNPVAMHLRTDLARVRVDA